MFSPRLLAVFQSVLPSAVADRLNPFEAVVRNYVESVAAGTPGGARVLDAGAGESRFKPLFAHTTYVGIDFAQGDMGWDYSGLEVVGRLEQLPFHTASFDRVLSIVVLEHTAEPAEVMKELARVLLAGGSLHMVVPHMWEEHQRPYDYFRFTSNGIRHVMEKAGLKVERVEPVGGFFWLLSRRLIALLSFTQQGWRWILFPILAPVFGLLLPLCCYYLDALDRDRSYTLGFVCEGLKDRLS